MTRQTSVATERDFEVLAELIWAHGQAEKFGRSAVAPIDCGGTNGSDHSYRLTKLVRLGYAEHKKRGLDWGQAPTRQRGSKIYRPTERGKAALEAWRKSRSSEPGVVRPSPGKGEGTPTAP